jgi:pyruvate formate lyase activating enzyme
MNLESLKLLVKHGLDAINFDVKGDAKAVERYCKADVDKVWKNITEARKMGIHVEITTLVIPGINDDEECLRGIAGRIKEIGDIPWHVTQYYPDYKAFEIGLYPKRTPVKILENAWRIGKEQGLRYVYIGNVPGHRYENTYCPTCNELLIRRLGFDVIDYKITSEKRCPRCEEKIPIVGSYIK